MFKNGNQVAAHGNEKTATQMIIELQDKNSTLRLALGKLIKICTDSEMQNVSEVWQQQIGYAKEVFTETGR